MVTPYPDSEIEREVVRLLRWDPRVDTSGLRVDMVDGPVRLSGTADRETILAAMTTTSSVMGVRSVENAIEKGQPQHDCATALQAEK